MKAKCEKHRGIKASGFCPICLINEVGQLRSDNAGLRRLVIAWEAASDQWQADFRGELERNVKLERTLAEVRKQLCAAREQMWGLEKKEREQMKQPTMTLGDPCPSCGGTDWICAGCQEKDVYT